MLCDNGNEFKGPLFHEALHKTILEECWRPAFARYLDPRFTGLRRELERYLTFYDHDASTMAASRAAASPRGHRLPCPQDGGEMSSLARLSRRASSGEPPRAEQASRFGTEGSVRARPQRWGGARRVPSRPPRRL